MPCRRTAQRLVLLFSLATGIPLFGQGMQLSVSNESTLPGGSIDAQVLIDNDQPIMAFSFGLRHDAARLTPTVIAEGAAVLALNGGTGPDFFQTDLAAANGPGITVACLFTLGAPTTLAVGIDHEAVVVTYSTSAGAPPASTTAITPAADLGNPTVSIVFTVAGQSFLPTTSVGTVSFLVPAPSNVACALTDGCNCQFQVTWTNSAIYTSIQVRRAGVLVATLPGNATSTSVSLLAPGSAQICVRGLFSTTASADTCCTANCPVITPAPPPTNLVCSLASSDPVLGCDVDLTWTLAGIYTGIDVLVDGVVEASLPGTASLTTITLPVDPVAAQICLRAFDECGDLIATLVCCDVTCLPGTLFVRSNCNADSGIDIGDAIYGLNVLFAGAGPAPCADACDVNDDGFHDISDAVYQLGALFSGGLPPPPPFPACGIDTTTDGQDCDSFPAC